MKYRDWKDKAQGKHKKVYLLSTRHSVNIKATNRQSADEDIWQNARINGDDSID